MHNKSLPAGWKNTAACLAEARNLLPAAAAHACADDLKQFHEFLSHNELEEALDILGWIFEQAEGVPLQAWKLMARAAENMQLTDKQLRYERRC